MRIRRDGAAALLTAPLAAEKQQENRSWAGQAWPARAALVYFCFAMT
jgi:hypothetical protein